MDEKAKNVDDCTMQYQHQLVWRCDILVLDEFTKIDIQIEIFYYP